MAKYKITTVHEVEAVNEGAACAKLAQYDADTVYRKTQQLLSEHPSWGQPEVRVVEVEIKVVGDGPG